MLSVKFQLGARQLSPGAPFAPPHACGVDCLWPPPSCQHPPRQHCSPGPHLPSPQPAPCTPSPASQQDPHQDYCRSRHPEAWAPFHPSPARSLSVHTSCSGPGPRLAHLPPSLQLLCFSSCLCLARSPSDAPVPRLFLGPETVLPPKPVPLMGQISANSLVPLPRPGSCPAAHALGPSIFPLGSRYRQDLASSWVTIQLTVASFRLPARRASPGLSAHEPGTVPGTLREDL